MKDLIRFLADMELGLIIGGFISLMTIGMTIGIMGYAMGSSKGFNQGWHEGAIGVYEGDIVVTEVNLPNETTEWHVTKVNREND